MTTTCHAYETETVTREVFNSQVVIKGNACVCLQFTNGEIVPLCDTFTLDQQMDLLRNWLQEHIQADRLARKEQ